MCPFGDAVYNGSIATVSNDVLCLSNTPEHFDDPTLDGMLNASFAGFPCAVCFLPTRATTYTSYGSNICPIGWDIEYRGFLASGLKSICIVEETPLLELPPELDPLGVGEDRSGYITGALLTCAVCSHV